MLIFAACGNNTLAIGTLDHYLTVIKTSPPFPFCFIDTKPLQTDTKKGTIVTKCTDIAVLVEMILLNTLERMLNSPRALENLMSKDDMISISTVRCMTIQPYKALPSACTSIEQLEDRLKPFLKLRTRSSKRFKGKNQETATPAQTDDKLSDSEGISKTKQKDRRQSVTPRDLFSQNSPNSDSSHEPILTQPPPVEVQVAHALPQNDNAQKRRAGNNGGGLPSEYLPSYRESPNNANSQSVINPLIEQFFRELPSYCDSPNNAKSQSVINPLIEQFFRENNQRKSSPEKNLSSHIAHYVKMALQETDGSIPFTYECIKDRVNDFLSLALSSREIPDDVRVPIHNILYGGNSKAGNSEDSQDVLMSGNSENAQDVMLDNTNAGQSEDDMDGINPEDDNAYMLDMERNGSGVRDGSKPEDDNTHGSVIDEPSLGINPEDEKRNDTLYPDIPDGTHQEDDNAHMSNVDEPDTKQNDTQLASLLTTPRSSQRGRGRERSEGVKKMYAIFYYFLQFHKSYHGKAGHVSRLKLLRLFALLLEDLPGEGVGGKKRKLEQSLGQWVDKFLPDEFHEKYQMLKRAKLKDSDKLLLNKNPWVALEEYRKDEICNSTTYFQRVPALGGKPLANTNDQINKAVQLAINYRSSGETKSRYDESLHQASTTVNPAGNTFENNPLRSETKSNPGQQAEVTYSIYSQKGDILLFYNIFFFSIISYLKIKNQYQIQSFHHHQNFIQRESPKKVELFEAGTDQPNRCRIP